MKTKKCMIDWDLVTDRWQGFNDGKGRLPFNPIRDVLSSVHQDRREDWCVLVDTSQVKRVDPFVGIKLGIIHVMYALLSGSMRLYC